MNNLQQAKQELDQTAEKIQSIKQKLPDQQPAANQPKQVNESNQQNKNNSQQGTIDKVKQKADQAFHKAHQELQQIIPSSDNSSNSDQKTNRSSSQSTNSQSDQQQSDQQQTNSDSSSQQSQQSESQQQSSQKQQQQKDTQKQDQDITQHQHVKDWPEDIRSLVSQMTKAYGQPDDISPYQVMWINKQPWESIIIFCRNVPHNFPSDHGDNLQQTIRYQVPLNKYDQLIQFNGSLTIRRTRGTLSSECTNQNFNIAIFNLAHQICQDKLTVDQAREQLVKIAQQLQETPDQPPELTQKLQFETPGDAADPDQEHPNLAPNQTEPEDKSHGTIKHQ